MIKYLIFLIPFILYGQDTIMIDGEPCGMSGSAKPGSIEFTQNRLKNRYIIPSDSLIDPSVTLKSLLSAKKGTYTDSTYVEIIGYVYNVKSGGIETCNCKTENTELRDTHIEITLNDLIISVKDRLVVEVTPRIREIMREQGVDWSTSMLRKNIKNKWVKITGWLFYDVSHQYENFADDPIDSMGKRNWSATSYEIHPITKIKIIHKK